MSTQQPEALRIIDRLGRTQTLKEPHQIYIEDAIQELRRLHSVNAELLDALKLARLVVNPAHAYGIAIDAAIAKATGETS
jgi:hypothetical protein